MGKTIQIVLSGVDNFEVKAGKVFPGCSILLTDKIGDTILSFADAFEDMNAGLDLVKANILTASLNTGEPMVIAQTYHLKVRFTTNKKQITKLYAMWIY